MCRFRPAGPGSRSTWGIGCASSCPWCKGGSGLRFCPHNLHTVSRTENLCPPGVAGCCLRDSPLSLQTQTEELMLTVPSVVHVTPRMLQFLLLPGKYCFVHSGVTGNVGSLCKMWIQSCVPPSTSEFMNYQISNSKPLNILLHQRVLWAAADCKSYQSTIADLIKGTVPSPVLLQESYESFSELICPWSLSHPHAVASLDLSWWMSVRW